MGNHAAACRVCGGADLHFLYEVRGCTLERCRACHFVQVASQPSPEELEAMYGDEYFASSKYDDELAQRRENDRRLALLSGLGLPEGAAVLDAGCATGDFITAAAPTFDMWGIELSHYAAEMARKNNPELAHQIFAGFVEDCELEPASFDAISMWDVLEHLRDPVAACRQLVALLRPGGYLVLSTPDIGALTARLMGRRWAFMTPPEHLGFFDASSMRRLLGELGLRPMSSTSLGKWANVGFIAHKLRRVFPLIPRLVVSAVQRSPLGKTSLYVPTGDIQYAVARKSEARDKSEAREMES